MPAALLIPIRGDAASGHSPEHQTLVVNLAVGAAIRAFHADSGLFRGAILGLMWLEHLSVKIAVYFYCDGLNLFPPAVTHTLVG